MTNIIKSCSLKQFVDHIETGVLLLQDQSLPVNYYTLGFVIQELNRYIAELEHPRYLAFITGGISIDGSMAITVYVGDRFNQEKWVESIEFTYPKDGNATRVVPPTVKGVGSIVIEKQPRTIVPVPIVENFDYAVQTRKSTQGIPRESRRGVSIKKVNKFKYTTYTEYVNFVSVLFDEFAGCTDCLNKSLIVAFLGNFSYPEVFVSSGKTIRQHLQLKSDIELNDEVKKKFQIDWGYFLDNWSDNAIFLAQYKTADTTLTCNKQHKSIDLVEQRVGPSQFALTDFGKIIWEHVHEILGFMEPDPVTEVKVGVNEPVGTLTPEEPEASAKEPKEEIPETPSVEEVKVRHMGYNKCNGCAYFDKHRQWCDKRQGYINTLEHDECFEEEKPKLEIATQNEVERICYNCKRWHSGNNPGSLKAIACRCPIQGKKTLTDHTCNKFVAIVKKEG